MTQKDLFEPKMHPKQREMVLKITTLLTGMGCKFYIKTPDSEVFSLGFKPMSGGVAPSVDKPDKPERKYKWGERTDYVRPYIEQIKETGAVVSIPLALGMTLKELMRITNSTAHGMLGKGQYQSETDAENNCVIVMNNGGIRV